ncbi:peptide chain release factor N(5)-glutamine methyltransferase [Pelagibacteraceae bacterium]|nr:peptide chain release factor N(5)-glutamine methyltransferase [Pelagibacteraceae bacterium]
MNNFIKSSYLKLKKNNIPNPELDLKILLEHASYDKKEIILSNINYKSIDLEHFKSLLLKRLNNEPISKIIKKKYFWKSVFFVNSNVLDPRPESEIIIEEALKNVVDKKKNLNILDIGTGSGCLAISLAKEFLNSKVNAIDVSVKAINVAKKNIKLHNLENRINVSLTKLDDINKKFDIIVSNPPYLSEVDYKNLQKDILNFEPKIALFGGKDGLKFYRMLSKKVAKLMKKNSIFICEIGNNQLDSCISIFDKKNFFLKKVTKDIQKIDRTLTFFKI